MEVSTCETCRFSKDGHCHRYPPKMVLWPQDNQRPEVLTPFPTFPFISPSDWCGEYQPMDGEFDEVEA